MLPIAVAAVIQLLAFAFLYLGIDNLVTILDDSLKANLKEDYHWTGSTYIIPVPGIIMFAASAILLVVYRKPGKKEETKESRETFSVIQD